MKRSDESGWCETDADSSQSIRNTAIECPPNIAAAHQAGVLLAAYLLGLQPLYAEIFAGHDDGCRWSGNVDHEPLEGRCGDLLADQAIAKAVLLAAGWVGEQTIGGAPHRGDWQNAIELAEEDGGEGPVLPDPWLPAVVRFVWWIFRYLHNEGRDLQRMLICKRRLELEDIGSVLSDRQVVGVAAVGRMVRLVAGGVR
ncbi:MAG: hypothetical protein H6961_01445 [Chromatiaceae bacterium]|nr:hypothetical protein [Chromatiaceae bacterium]